MKSKQSVKQNVFIFYLSFTVILLLGRQKHLVPFYITKNELKEVLY